MKTEIISREYCSWEPVVVESFDPGSQIFLRGDLNGPLDFDFNNKCFCGCFEFPAKGSVTGVYEIVCKNGNEENIIRKVQVEYTFNNKYFSPRWENVDLINRFLANHYPCVKRKVIYRYEKFKRDIQLLSITEPSSDIEDKQIIFITGRIHNPESGMTTALYRFVNWLLHSGNAFLEKYLFLVVPMTIPLTFDEDPRKHNVNRQWLPEMNDPDLMAIRDKIIDKFLPEIWIDCHSFNDVLPLDNLTEERKICGDYVVAHPVGEMFFDKPCNTEIALQIIRAAEKKGHKHRNEAFFKWWAEHMIKVLPHRPGEKFLTDHHPEGIFSGIDYAKYADRIKFGINGRDWPAMACDYGYFRCHAVNLCLECKPLHVSSGSGTIHYPASFPDSNKVKLQELCRIGQDDFSGQPFSGFPCNIIIPDIDFNNDSAMLCAGGDNRQKIRKSRYILWKNRHSIVVATQRISEKYTVKIECIAAIQCAAILRLSGTVGGKVTVNGMTVKTYCKHNITFVQFIMEQGNIVVETP